MRSQWLHFNARKPFGARDSVEGENGSYDELPRSIVGKAFYLRMPAFSRFDNSQKILDVHRAEKISVG
jgi:hypothetical protein